jgi:hypothetical protein
VTIRRDEKTTSERTQVRGVRQPQRLRKEQNDGFHCHLGCSRTAFRWAFISREALVYRWTCGKNRGTLELVVTLVDVIAFHRRGRTRHRFRFRDEQGHCFVWWTDIYDVGIPARSRASTRMTVTDHSRYRGNDETVVQNVRVHAVNSEHDGKSVI